MARISKLDDEDLRELATYLRQPCVETEIEVETPVSRLKRIEAEYAKLTKNHPFPQTDGKAPVYIWDPSKNKWGAEFRIYYLRDEKTITGLVEDIKADFGHWKGKPKIRINSGDIAQQLFECGFVLGHNKGNEARIKQFMAERFAQYQPRADLGI